MKKIVLTYFLFLVAISQSISQMWNLAGPIPFANRYDDICFVDSQTGWTVNSEGQIFKTIDGGESWISQYNASYYFRSVEFLDAMTGFAGTLNDVLLRTTDGGDTWQHIESLIPTPIDGICGLSHFGDNVYGVGIWSYPAYFIKSTDRGDTWTYSDLSGYASGLVDCHFIDENIGFVSGINENVGAVILKTIDGGNSWQFVFNSNDGMEYIWKMDFVNPDVGFGSIESFANATSIVKTTDGGDTWGEYPVTSIALDIQGIGFANELKGWVGPRNSGMWETNDGGLNWSPLGDFQNVNRIFRLDEEHLFASAHVIFKYDNTITATENIQPVNAHEILDVTPNPFSTNMEIKIRIDKSTFVRLDILSIDGKLISYVANERLEPGIHNFHLSEKTIASLKDGYYILLFRTNEGFLTKQIIKVSER